MSDSVQQGSGQAFRAEDLGSLIEGQVGGDQDGAPLVALAEDLKEEFRAGGGQGHEACSSMISRLRRDSCRCRLSSCFSSRASISSWTRAAAVVKPTDIPRWQAARPSPGNWRPSTSVSPISLSGAPPSMATDSPPSGLPYGAQRLWKHRFPNQDPGPIPETATLVAETSASLSKHPFHADRPWLATYLEIFRLPFAQPCPTRLPSGG